MAIGHNPLFHESVIYSLPAAIIASALSSALVMWQTGAPLQNVLRVAVPNLAVFVALWVWNSRIWNKRDFIAIPYEKQPLPAKAVVAMVSMGRGSETAKAAAEFHKNTIEHVWLITTPLAEQDAHRIACEIEALKPGVVVHPLALLDNSHTIENVKAEVEKIRRGALKLPGISEMDLICDFTGLTKQASAGMVLACSRRRARLQYIQGAEFDERGRAIRPAKPVEVEVAYQLSSDDDDYA